MRAAYRQREKIWDRLLSVGPLTAHCCLLDVNGSFDRYGKTGGSVTLPAPYLFGMRD